MLTLTVTEHGFVYKPKRGKRQALHELWAPLGCVYEHLEVYRNGKKFDEATVHMIGTHGAYEAFNGLQKISASRPYHMSITADLFQVGDELRFSNLPKKFSESKYWRGMIFGGKVQKLPD